MTPPTGPDRFFDLLSGPGFLLAIAAGPVIASLVARSYALEPGRRPAQAWFGFRMLSSWAMTAMWMVWPLAIGDGRALRPLVAVATAGGRLAVEAAVLAATLLPLLASSIAIVLITRDVTRRLRDEGWSEEESRRQVMMQIAALAVATIGLGIAGMLAMNGSVRPALLIGVASVTAALVCLARYRRLAGLEVQAITFGELPMRLFDMASKVGVPLRQLHVMPMARSRIANAFALSNQSVILTDYLIQKLSRRELEAVMAHELAHLRMKHPIKIVMSMLVVIVPATVAMMYAGSWQYIGLVVLAGLFVRLLVARRFEYEADREAVRICGDPEALISGLAALGDANVMPIHWNRRVELLMTHPSTLRRIERIAAEGGVTADRLAALLRREGLGDPSFEMPRTLTGKAFSSTWKRTILQQLSLIRLAVAAGVPALLISIAGFLTPRPILFWGASALAFLTLLLSHERLAVAVIAKLEGKVRARESDENANDRTFVALSPGDGPRVYEGFLDWDLGLLTLAADRIEYAGEETRFRLSRADVTGIELTPGVGAWIKVPWIRIAWRDASGAEESFCVRPAGTNRLSATRAAAQVLFAKLESWRAASIVPEVPVGEGVAGGLPPREAHVTGEPLSRVVSPRAFGQMIPWLVAATAVACAMFGLPFNPFRGPGWMEATGAAMIAMIAFQLPHWLSRPAPRAVRSEPDAQAA